MIPREKGQINYKGFAPKLEDAFYSVSLCSTADRDFQTLG